MIEATLTFLRAQQEERVAIVGVVSALFCDDPHEGVRRLRAAADAARECEGNAPRNARRQRAIYRRVAQVADELRPMVEQLADYRVEQESAGG